MTEIEKRPDEVSNRSKRQAEFQRRRDERLKSLSEAFRRKLAEYDEAERAIYLKGARERQTLGL